MLTETGRYAARTQRGKRRCGAYSDRAFLQLFALLLTQPARAATTIEFWHAMSGALGERVDELADKFNKSQSDYVSRPVAQGRLRRRRQQHDRRLPGEAAASDRAGERARLSDHADRRARSLPTAELMAKAGYKIDWSDFIAPVATYYTKDGADDGDAVQLVDADPVLQRRSLQSGGLRRAGRDLARARSAALRHQQEGHLEMRHGLPGRLGVELPRELQRHRRSSLRHEAQRLRRARRRVRLQQDRSSATWSASRSCSTTASSSLPARASIPGSSSSAASARRSSTRRRRMRRSRPGPSSIGARPSCRPRTDSPAKNSTIGGAALWTLKGHKDEDYKGVAAFYNFLAKSTRRSGGTRRPATCR